MHRPIRLIITMSCTASLTVAVVLAFVIWVAPWWHVQQMIAGIVSDDEAVRADSWSWLSQPDSHADEVQPRVAGYMSVIQQRLLDADEASLADAAAALRQLHLWRWDDQPRELLMRDLDRLSRGDVDDHGLAIELLESVPLEPADREVIASAVRLLQSEREEIRVAAFAALLAWVGVDRVEMLEGLVDEAGDARVGAMFTLGRGVAASLRVARRELDRVRDAESSGVAQRSIDSVDAMFSADDLPHAAVFAHVLIAERDLSTGDCAEPAAAWIGSFDDRRKRAGALLAALLQLHEPLLRRAYAIEDSPRVRTIQRLALWSFEKGDSSRDVADGIDPRVLAHRSMHRDDLNDFDPDVALAMCLAGDTSVLTLLTSPPLGKNVQRSAQQRAWLIERFVPLWHRAIERPTEPLIDALDQHQRRLNMARLLTMGRLRFNGQRRVFELDDHAVVGPPSRERLDS